MQNQNNAQSTGSDFEEAIHQIVYESDSDSVHSDDSTQASDYGNFRDLEFFEEGKTINE